MALLYIALWIIATAALLQFMADRETGVGTYRPLPPADAAPYELPFLGINVSLEQYEEDDECRERLIALRQDGFGWARQRLDWEEIEPQPSTNDWQRSDAIVRCIADAGVVPVIVLDGSPSWARTGADEADNTNPNAPPADFERYADFAAAVAGRYGDSIRFYQIWDEPNIAPHWGSRWINPVEYGQMLQLASEAIRAEDSDAVIILGALAPTSDRGHLGIDEVYFLQRLYAAGAQSYFDAVALQPFGFGRTPSDSAARLDVLNFQRAELVRRAMVAAGDGKTPIVAARFGWNRRPFVEWGTVHRINQAEFAGEAVDFAYRQWPWMAAMAWAIDRPNGPVTDAIWGFSLDRGLIETLSGWNLRRPSRDGASAPAARRDWYRWALLTAATAVAVWRLTAAVSVLPDTKWRNVYRSAPLAAKILVWALVLTVYYVATWPPLLLLCWLVAAWLILAQPAAGLLLAAIVLPFHFQHKEIQWGSLHTIVAPAVAASLCLVPALLVEAHRRRSIDRWATLAFGWLAVTAAGAATVWYWPAYWRGVLELAVIPLILFWSVRTFLRTGNERRSVLGALVIGGSIAAVIGVADWLGGGGTEADSVRRLVGPYFSANHTALYLERCLFVALGLAAFYRRLPQWFYVLAAVLVALALLLTSSRGALLIGVPAGLLVLGLFAASRHRRTGRPIRSARVVWAALGLLLAGVVTATTIPWERLSNSATVLDRILLWRAALPLWQDHWLAGVGPNGFFWRFPAYIPIGSGLDPNLQHPHNLWLEFATSGGVLGLVWLIGATVVVGASYLAALHSPRIGPDWPAAGIVAALAAAIAHAQVDAFAALPDLAQWNWMALGVLSVGLSSVQHEDRQTNRK